MPSPESIDFQSNDELADALLDILEVKTDTEAESIPHLADGPSADFGLVGAKIKLNQKIKKVLKNMSLVAPIATEAKNYHSPLLLVIGQTTKYKANQVIETLRQKTTPQLLFCTMEKGTSLSGLQIVIKDENDEVLFSSEEVSTPQSEDLSAEQKIKTTLEAYFETLSQANLNTQQKPIITLSNYALDIPSDTQKMAHVDLLKKEIKTIDTLNE